MSEMSCGPIPQPCNEIVDSLNAIFQTKLVNCPCFRPFLNCSSSLTLSCIVSAFAILVYDYGTLSTQCTTSVSYKSLVITLGNEKDLVWVRRTRLSEFSSDSVKFQFSGPRLGWGTALFIAVSRCYLINLRPPHCSLQIRYSTLIFVT